MVSCLEPSDLLFWNQHEVLLICNSNSFWIQHFLKRFVDEMDDDGCYLHFTIFNSPRKALSHWVSSGTCILHVSWNNMKHHGTSPPGVHRFYILCRATKRKRLSEKSTPHSSWINVAMGFNNSVLAVNTAIFSWAPQFSSSLAGLEQLTHLQHPNHLQTPNLICRILLPKRCESATKLEDHIITSCSFWPSSVPSGRRILSLMVEQLMSWESSKNMTKVGVQDEVQLYLHGGHIDNMQTSAYRIPV